MDCNNPSRGNDSTLPRQSRDSVPFLSKLPMDVSQTTITENSKMCLETQNSLENVNTLFRKKHRL